MSFLRREKVFFLFAFLHNLKETGKRKRGKLRVLMMSLKLIGEKLANLCRHMFFTSAHCKTEHLEKRERWGNFSEDMNK